MLAGGIFLYLRCRGTGSLWHGYGTAAFAAVSGAGLMIGQATSRTVPAFIEVASGALATPSIVALFIFVLDRHCRYLPHRSAMTENGCTKVASSRCSARHG